MFHKIDVFHSGAFLLFMSFGIAEVAYNASHMPE